MSTTPLVPKRRMASPPRASICLQIAVDAENQPPILAVLALPVVDPARLHAGQAFVDPDLLARRRVERDERVVPPGDVDDVVDDDRIEARAWRTRAALCAGMRKCNAATAQITIEIELSRIASLSRAVGS